MSIPVYPIPSTSINGPVTTSGGQDKVWVSNLDVEGALNEVVKQLKINNMHMSLMTDANVTKKEIE
jgi:hypothetical protein